MARCPPPACPWGLHTRRVALSPCAELTGPPGSLSGQTNGSLCGQASLHLTSSHGGVAVHDVTLTVVGRVPCRRCQMRVTEVHGTPQRTYSATKQTCGVGEGLLLAWSQCSRSISRVEGRSEFRSTRLTDTRSAVVTAGSFANVSGIWFTSVMANPGVAQALALTRNGDSDSMA